jgi:Tol biopolymer transport system component
MKFIQLVFILGYAITVFASDSPDTREISDPKSIVSSAAEGVAPISVDDLIYTRSIGAGAWSPDGKQIVFITNLARAQQPLEGQLRWRLACPAQPV